MSDITQALAEDYSAKLRAAGKGRWVASGEQASILFTKQVLGRVRAANSTSAAVQWLRVNTQLTNVWGELGIVSGTVDTWGLYVSARVPKSLMGLETSISLGECGAL